MTLPYESRPTLVFRAKRLIPASFVDAMVISSVALVVSLALFGIFVTFSGVNPFDVYHVMYRGAFGNAYACATRSFTPPPCCSPRCALPCRLVSG